MNPIKIPARGRERLVLIDLDDLYEICTDAMDHRPYDGRTKEGRAFVEGVWAVQQAAHRLAGEEAP